MKNIVFLYSELMPYNIPVLKELYEMGYCVHVVRWDVVKLTPYNPPIIDGVTYYLRSKFHKLNKLLELVESLKPVVIYTSGWMDSTYSMVAKQMRIKYNTPVIAACDTQWNGGKQWLNVIFSKFRHKKWFSHVLVGGMWQYEYARRLGFSKFQILTHVYSADNKVFEKVNIDIKKDNYPKNFLYIGRFSHEKGIEDLVKAWNDIEDNHGWTLTLIGNGSLKQMLEKNKNIIVKDFMSQDELALEMQNSGCFILPSRFEPWALVLHEAAAGGLPILASQTCGAVPYFVLNKYNGLVFQPNQVLEMKSKIVEIINSPTDKLIEMSCRSRALSHRINPKIVASAIISICK